MKRASEGCRQRWSPGGALATALALGVVVSLGGGGAAAQMGQPSLEPSEPGEPAMGDDQAQVDARMLTEMHHLAKLQEEQAEKAEKKAASPQVRDFARLVKSDAERLADRTEDLAERKDLSLPDVDEEQDPSMQRLESASGLEVDRTFVETVADQDRELGRALDRASNSTDPEVKRLAQEYRPVLKQHRNMASALKSESKGAGKGDKKGERPPAGEAPPY